MTVSGLPRRFKLLLSLVVALGLANAACALQVTDDRGVVVTFDKSPQRIVSLLPSLTESVCELGECHRLVGVDRYSNFPDSVQKLPLVGGGLDPNIEAVVALKPDVVLMATSSRASERLRALGLKVVALERGADRTTTADYTVPRVRDELRFVHRHDLMQNTSRDTITVQPSRHVSGFQSVGRQRVLSP